MIRSNISMRLPVMLQEDDATFFPEMIIPSKYIRGKDGSISPSSYFAARISSTKIDAPSVAHLRRHLRPDPRVQKVRDVLLGHATALFDLSACSLPPMVPHVLLLHVEALVVQAADGLRALCHDGYPLALYLPARKVASAFLLHQIKGWTKLTA